MDIQILDVSKMKQPVDIKKRYQIQPSPGEKCTITKTPSYFQKIWYPVMRYIVKELKKV